MTLLAEPPEQTRLAVSARRALLDHRGARVGVGIACLVAGIALLAPRFLPDPNEPDYKNQLAKPSREHLLGTDGAGRDLLSRTVDGARTSLGAAVIVMLIAIVLGLAVGVIAAVAGGAVDATISRLTDVLLGLPSTVLTLALVGVLGPSFVNLVLAMSLTNWARLAKLSRAHARGSTGRPDIVAARMAGAGRVRIAAQHVLPGAATLVIIAETLAIGETVIILAGLSFLGLGAQPPTAEWGNMLSESRETLTYAPWQIIGPATGLVLTMLAATLISDAMRDVAEPSGRA